MKPFDLHGLKTYDLASRPSKVFVEDLGQPPDAGASVGDWIDSLPRQLAGNDLRRVRTAFMFDRKLTAYLQARVALDALGRRDLRLAYAESRQAARSLCAYALLRGRAWNQAA